MASCPPFQVTVQGDLQQTLDRVRADVQAHGGQFSGDLTSGSVSGPVPVLGTIEADYAVEGNTVTITVTNRPFLVPCSTIETQAQQYFSGL
jgi:hypothetical protein